MPTLPDEEVRTRLGDLPGWELGQGEIVREFRLADFREAVTFVVRLSYEAEAANHHPDLDIRWNRVRVALSTHSEGGVTGKDIDLARTITSLAG